MAPGTRRISIGFQGGQVLALRVSESSSRRSRRRSAAAAGTSSRRGRAVRLDLGQVVYVRAESDERFRASGFWRA